MPLKMVGVPIVMETGARTARTANGTVELPREVRVFTIYRGAGTLECDCPRVVKLDGLAVWHSPECPELNRA